MALGVSLTREGTGDWLVLGQVSVPLASGSTASYAAAQARRDVQALEFEATHAQERMKNLGGDLRRQLEVRTRMLEHVQRSELAPARQAGTIIEHQFRAGKVPLHALLAVRDTVFHAEVQALQVQKELALAQIRLAWVEGWLASWVKGEL
jgi:outer membrane protein TolC